MHLKIVQNAYVVPDLEFACERLLKEFDVGPFILASDLELSGHRYRGTASDPIVLDAAFAQSGSLNIEIIKVKSSGPSAFADMFEGSQSGLHHVAHFCDDYEATRDRLASLGYPAASEFTIGDGIAISYVDTRPMFGHMIELYPKHDLLFDLYERVRTLRDGWNGRDILIPW